MNRMAVRGQTTYRQRQAQRTREVIAASARRLFAERGYVATTIEAISGAAEIPVPTIYSALGNKPAILEEIRRTWIAESGVEELHREALSTSEPRARLRLAAHWTRRQFELGHDVIAIYQEAARIDSRAALVWRRALAGREAALDQLVHSLKGRLRPRLKPAAALDIYIVCTLPEAYRALVLDRRWSPDQYEEWLAELLVLELLGG
jgi:AcrR family transcriptional regulator